MAILIRKHQLALTLMDCIRVLLMQRTLPDNQCSLEFHKISVFLKRRHNTLAFKYRYISRLECWVKFSADDILKYIFLFFLDIRL